MTTHVGRTLISKRRGAYAEHRKALKGSPVKVPKYAENMGILRTDRSRRLRSVLRKRRFPAFFNVSSPSQGWPSRAQQANWYSLKENRQTTPTLLLHDFTRTLPSLGSWKQPVAAAKIKKTVRTMVAGKRVSKSVTIDRNSRDSVLHVSAAPILVCAPKVRRGKQ